MKKSAEVKEKIIEAAIALIQEGNGNSDEITTRAIAEKASVGIGLINYHFQTKENLITICVQRIIGQVISDFKPNDTDFKTEQERLTNTAAEVFEFLFENPSISRISILSDFTVPTITGNTTLSQKGIRLAMGENMSEEDGRLISFVLVSAMQTAFLNSTIMKESMGFSLDSPDERRAYISRLVELLYRGIKQCGGTDERHK